MRKFWQVVYSVLAAFIGVQSERQRQHDFTHGQAWHYIAVGALLTLLLVLGLWWVVRMVV